MSAGRIAEALEPRVDPRPDCEPFGMTDLPETPDGVGAFRLRTEMGRVCHAGYERNDRC